MQFFVFAFVTPYLKHILNKNRSLFCNVTSIFFQLRKIFNWHEITRFQRKIINLIHCYLYDEFNHINEIAFSGFETIIDISYILLSFR